MIDSLPIESNPASLYRHCAGRLVIDVLRLAAHNTQEFVNMQTEKRRL